MPKKIIKKIRWVREALTDLERLHAFLYSKDANAAARAVSTIREGARLVSLSPLIGRPTPDSTGQRELFISFGAGAYVLRYKLDDDETPVIIRVWHSREERSE